MIHLKQVKAEEVYELRHKVLRPDQGLSAVAVDSDGHDSTVHFAALSEGKVVSCVSLFLNDNPCFPQGNQAQIRFLATYPEYRGAGFGSALMRLAEHHAFIEKECGLAWLNARVPYVAFYEKLGYSCFGKEFMIQDVCMHVGMMKAKNEYKSCPCRT